MKHIYLLFVLSFLLTPASAQVQYEFFASEKLGEERKLKIQLPRNYKDNPEKRYPLILVLDGDYLFEPTAGAVDYYSYWDDIPESIVVGLLQSGSRREDCQVDPKTELPIKKGALFFEFLGMELLPYLDRTYRTSRFTAIVGHDLTANFSNYYLFKEEPLFQAYLNLSPDLSSTAEERLQEVLARTERPTWFYLATGSHDAEELRKEILSLDRSISQIKNDNLFYRFEDFEGATHYTLVGRAIPKALETIFRPYQPMGTQQYETLLAGPGSPLESLQQKYQNIEDLYGLEKKIRVNDFLNVANALESLQKWDELESLGELARNQYPRSTLGYYFLGKSYEAQGRPKKAMRTYKSAYGQEEVAFITVDFMLEKARIIEQDFGY